MIYNVRMENYFFSLEIPALWILKKRFVPYLAFMVEFLMVCKLHLLTLLDSVEQFLFKTWFAK